MSTIPIAKQIRRTITLADGSVKYEVTTSIINKGDLPFTELFVVKIVDPAAVKSDVLVKVATPHELRRADTTGDIFVKVDTTDLVTLGADLFANIASVDEVTELLRDRVLAVRRNQSTYLTSNVTLLYDNLTTADAAYREILARLSDLVNNWRQYNSNYVTNPSQNYNLPQTAISVEDEKIATYKTKKQARVAAETNRDAAQVAKDNCEVQQQADQKIYGIVVEDYTFLQVAKNIVNAITETGSANAKNFALKLGIYSSSTESYEVLLQKRFTDMNTYETLIRTHNETCAQLTTELALAQAAVDAAKIEENNALAAVLAVCPTFDPESV